MECDGKESLLPARLHAAADVEERAGKRAVPDDPDRAQLLDDIERAGIARRARHVHRRCKTTDDLRELMRGARRAGCAAHEQAEAEGRNDGDGSPAYAHVS